MGIRTVTALWIALSWATLGCNSDNGTASQNAPQTRSDAGAAKADAGAVKTVAIDRSALTDVGTDKPLDYSDPRLWLCRPGNDPDECDANLDATELLADGTQKLVKHVKADNPDYDCFYVYPTVKLTSAGAMTDFANFEIALDPLLNQAARFNQQCRVYAPLYRQAGVVPGAGGAPTLPDAGAGSPAPTDTFALGLSDVRDAFKYYLEHLNNGRKFVLLGHSQGTGMLTSMMTTDVDPVADVRAKLISALLIGGGIAVPEGAAVGGTFKNIPLCTAAKQLGCVVAYNSFTKEVPPSPTSTFARTSMPGQMNGCTEPAMLAGHPGQRYQGSYIALNLGNKSLLLPDGFDKLPKDITTPFVLYRDVLRGACKNTDGASYLEISLDMSSSDKRPPPPYRFSVIESALGLHLYDYNIELDDLLEMVQLQAKAAGL
jgi:Protein of unknown function (DUF3089)